jgi:ATP-dependent protease ClpP protease subunit
MTDQTLELRGPVGGETFNLLQVQNFLRKANGPVRIFVASSGGCAATSSAVYCLLRDYPGEVSCLIDHCGSAAVAPAMAAGRRAIVAGGSIFVHRSWLVTTGTCTDLQQQADQLRELDALNAKIYAEATGQTIESIFDLMDKSAVLDASEAVALGFADQIVDQPGGLLSEPEVWHKTAAYMAQRGIDHLDRCERKNPADVQAIGLSRYTADHLPDAFPCDAPAASRPLVTASEREELRRRHRDLFCRLKMRLYSFGQGCAPDPRKSPVSAVWACQKCNAENFHPPGRDGRPAPCTTCKNEEMK